MENFIQYIGKFHPLLVHLPIGILIAAVLFDFLSKKDKYKTLGASVKMLYFLGTLGASASCLTGYILSTSGEYAGSSLQFHQWFGIAVALLGLALYYFRFKVNDKKPLTMKQQRLNLFFQYLNINEEGNIVYVCFCVRG